MRVRLHIAELVLHGVPAAQRHAIADALQAELQQRLQSGALPEAWQNGLHLPTLTVPQVTVPVGAPPARVGRAIGASLHTGLGPGERGGAKR